MLFAAPYTISSGVTEVRDTGSSRVRTGGPSLISIVTSIRPITQNDCITNESLTQNDRMNQSKCAIESIIVSDNNKDNNKDDNKSNYLPTYESQAGEERKVVSVLGEEEC